MSECKTYRLGEIATFKYGKLPPKNSNIGQYPIWSGYRYVGYTSTFNCPKNSIIVIARGVGGTGDVKIAKEDCFLTNLSIIVNIDTSICNSYYFYYQYLLSNLKYLDSGSAQSQITIEDLKRLNIKLPSLILQNRTVKILKSFEDKIELNRRINANLEEQAQALFKSWFVDFEPFRDSLFVDSELGKIPQGWKEGNYTDIVEIRGGGTPKTDMQEYWNGNIPFFSPKDVGAGCFILDTEKHITAKGLENCNSSLFQPNTVFITARGTVGKVVMSGTEMAMNQTNYALLGKQNIPQYYVYHITLQLVGRLLKKANGAVFNAITTRDFACEQIVIPPYSTIKHFSDIVKPIYENILLNEVQSNRLSALRDTLLPKLMSGEISVEKGFTD